MITEQKRLDEKQAERARLKVALAIYAKQIRSMEVLLETDRSLIAGKLLKHLQAIEILYGIQNKLSEQLESVSTDIDLLILKIDQKKN